eukprot:m.1542113 g.1542113  ORF g.1542113 m.1542113 type:complete len:76 (+) comp25254_c0_seq9:139-366(+)
MSKFDDGEKTWQSQEQTPAGAHTISRSSRHKSYHGAKDMFSQGKVLATFLEKLRSHLRVGLRLCSIAEYIWVTDS